MWYDQAPADYARCLIDGAERSDQQAARYRTEGKPWSDYEVKRAEQQARRLRAMAALCLTSLAPTAGNVDFLGLNRPEISGEQELRQIIAAEQLAAERRAQTPTP